MGNFTLALTTPGQFGAERHKGVLGEIRFPGIELDDRKLLVAQVLRPHLEKRGLAGPPGGIHGQDARPLVSADQAGERFHRFFAVQQVVLERVFFGDFDGLGLYAERFHCRSSDCPLKGRANGPQYSMALASRRRLRCCPGTPCFGSLPRCRRTGRKSEAEIRRLSDFPGGPLGMLWPATGSIDDPGALERWRHKTPRPG